MSKKYKIALVGLGSIGKRHLVNVSVVLEKRGIEYTIDLIRRENSYPLDKSLDDLVSKVYSENDVIPDDYDVIFVTNPTHLHFDTIKKYQNKTKNMFVEKPIFDETTKDILDLSLNPNGIYYVACPLRYSEVIQYVKNSINLESVYSARAICSSYLPDWRHGIDYRTTYSASIDQGGGASIDLIHEWDYLIYLFGKPLQIFNLRGKFSSLEIDSDDLSVYIAKYKQLLVEVHLDYLGRKPIRELQLFTSEDTIVVDLVNSEIRFLKERTTLKFNEVNNSYYLKELDYFFDALEGKASNENDFIAALTTLSIAKGGKLL